ncbi:hypothetical protein [Rhizobium leguminosarum]|uniref:hypothetical protein n=1 Tax=Rhizobium leguminosarum TaxID=384 RepID=UPI001441C830|nr:hypothetical protein [Rhizobium leguminosarum]NKK43481.1 hypothetical protein [Rhizobium leguminosarum bv. viciae]
MKDHRHNRKRRNCYDRLRARYLTAGRARRADPAASASMQLLAIFAMIFGRLPSPITAPANVPYSPPQLSPAAAQRSDMARRLGVPVRYLDLTLSQGHVPYSVLFDHIRHGGVLRRDAMIQLRKRVPEESLDWLDDIQKLGRWTELVRCSVPKEPEEQTDIRMLSATLLWIEETKGQSKSKISSTPPSNVEEPNADGDPQKPKP